MPDYFHIAGSKQFREEPVHNKVLLVNLL